MTQSCCPQKVMIWDAIKAEILCSLSSPSKKTQAWQEVYPGHADGDNVNQARCMGPQLIKLMERSVTGTVNSQAWETGKLTTSTVRDMEGKKIAHFHYYRWCIWCTVVLWPMDCMQIIQWSQDCIKLQLSTHACLCRSLPLLSLYEKKKKKKGN